MTFDQAYDDVVAGCADPSRPGAWIDDRITAAYRRLFDLGWAHSVEVWRDGSWSAGLYGVAIGGLFAGESMFHRERDASKVALMALVDAARRRSARPAARRAVVDDAPGQPRRGRDRPRRLPAAARRALRCRSRAWRWRGWRSARWRGPVRLRREVDSVRPSAVRGSRGRARRCVPGSSSERAPADRAADRVAVAQASTRASTKSLTSAAASRKVPAQTCSRHSDKTTTSASWCQVRRMARPLPRASRNTSPCGRSTPRDMAP